MIIKREQGVRAGSAANPETAKPRRKWAQWRAGARTQPASTQQEPDFPEALGEALGLESSHVEREKDTVGALPPPSPLGTGVPSHKMWAPEGFWNVCGGPASSLALAQPFRWLFHLHLKAQPAPGKLCPAASFSREQACRGRDLHAQWLLGQSTGSLFLNPNIQPQITRYTKKSTGVKYKVQG